MAMAIDLKAFKNLKGSQSLGLSPSEELKSLSETARQQALPKTDRELFDFLNKEGASAEAKADSPEQKNARRAKMSPDQREKLEFLEKAQAQLQSIKDKYNEKNKTATYPQNMMNAVAMQYELDMYKRSLPEDQRELLDKTVRESMTRPGGVYPFREGFPGFDQPKIGPTRNPFEGLLDGWLGPKKGKTIEAADRILEMPLGVPVHSGPVSDVYHVSDAPKADRGQISDDVCRVPLNLRRQDQSEKLWVNQ